MQVMKDHIQAILELLYFFYHICHLLSPKTALVNAHATAEIAKIDEVWISVKPKSLAKGGTKTKTKDWPSPTVNRPNFNHEEPDRDIKIF